MAKRQALTADTVRQILDYNPETGIFRWRQRSPEMFECGGHSAAHTCASWNSKHSGAIAGSNVNGYIHIKIGRRLYSAHRLAWLVMTGEWPSRDIDHIDINKSNNAFQNLREATMSQNQANTPVRSDNSSGLKGVYWRKDSRKWCASIMKHGKRQHLGMFDSPELANDAYKTAAFKLNGEFARTS